MIIADSEIEVFGESTSHAVYLMKVAVDRIKWCNIGCTFRFITFNIIYGMNSFQIDRIFLPIIKVMEQLLISGIKEQIGIFKDLGEKN